MAISDEGRAILWDWRKDQRRTLGGERNQQTTRSAFSADGTQVMVASQGQVTAWDLQQASSRVIITQPQADLRYAFSQDGTRLAAADDIAAMTRLLAD